MNHDIRHLVRGIYDLQKLRISVGNRITRNFKSKLGQHDQMSEEQLAKEALKLLKQLRASYDRITDGIATLPTVRQFKGDGIIDTYAELILVDQYVRLLADEQAGFTRLKATLEGIPIYDEFLEDVVGIGPAMAGVIISEIDIHQAEYPSSLWMYAGLDVAPDGAGRSRRKEHLIDKTYVDKDKNTSIRKSITFNPLLKTKLVGVLGPSFIKQSPSKCEYRQVYDNYKNRLENHPKHVDKSKGHRHNMAVRYMIKRFLVDLYTAWRTLEGLPVAPEYSEAKLGMIHKKAA